MSIFSFFGNKNNKDINQDMSQEMDSDFVEHEPRIKYKGVINFEGEIFESELLDSSDEAFDFIEDWIGSYATGREVMHMAEPDEHTEFQSWELNDLDSYVEQYVEGVDF